VYNLNFDILMFDVFDFVKKRCVYLATGHEWLVAKAAIWWLLLPASSRDDLYFLAKFRILCACVYARTWVDENNFLNSSCMYMPNNRLNGGSMPHKADN
jgi:hypothetical protein